MIEALPFDSSLFGYRVGKAKVSQSWDEKDFLEKSVDFQLVYLFSDSELNFRSEAIKLADVRATFAKDLERPSSEYFGIARFKGELNQQLSELALESGVYSRFKLDTRLAKGEFEKLYRLWIQKAWERQEILCSSDQEALVTVSVENSLANIGLLAVSPKHRRKGWGTRLVRSAEVFGWKNGARRMTISTQESNLAACELYQNQGYTLDQKSYIYHFWRS